MPIGAPSQTPYRATKGEGEDWHVVQPENLSARICVVKGDNAMNNAHFIARACNSYDLALEAMKMALLVLNIRRADNLQEILALEEAIAISEDGI